MLMLFALSCIQKITPRRCKAWFPTLPTSILHYVASCSASWKGSNIILWVHKMDNGGLPHLFMVQLFDQHSRWNGKRPEQKIEFYGMLIVHWKWPFIYWLLHCLKRSPRGRWRAEKKQKKVGVCRRKGQILFSFHIGELQIIWTGLWECGQR